MWRTAGSPIIEARLASAGMFAFTTAELATLAWRAIAPITSERPFISMVSRPSTFDRSISCAGRASRCFITGTSVWPPAISLASSVLASRFAA